MPTRQNCPAIPFLLQLTLNHAILPLVFVISVESSLFCRLVALSLNFFIPIPADGLLQLAPLSVGV